MMNFKSIIIGFLSATCIFLFIGMTDKEIEQKKKWLKEFPESGRYLPVSFTDEVFDQLFEKEAVEINDKKFEIARYSESYITHNDSIGNFFYEVTMNGYPIHVFEVFPPHVGVEPNDELYAEWTISKKL